jgi:hypothetical protein
MTDVQAIAPDERALRQHLSSARFQQGVDDGRWRLISLTWPHALIEVAAAPRDGAPSQFLLRFELSGYPLPGPTAGLWDTQTGSYLGAAGRPKGERATLIFRGDWEQGRALYAAWDRVALAGHPDWAQRFPRHAWSNTRDLAFYLANVFEVLNSDDYLGV